MLSIQIGLWPAPQPQIEQRATVEVLREKKKSPRLSESCRARLINYLGAPSIPFLHPIHHPNPQLRNQSHHTRGIPKFPLSKIFFFFFFTPNPATVPARSFSREEGQLRTKNLLWASAISILDDDDSNWCLSCQR